MDFSEKLQELRKQKHLTQEELAEALFVSRTAISKWESGRGYPNLDSLKAIATFFSVSIDELLSSNQVLSIAQKEQAHKETRFRDLTFGLLDCAFFMLFFLPFFAQKTDGLIQSVALLDVTKISTYLLVFYYIFSISITLWGVLTLALQNLQAVFWKKVKTLVSLSLHVAGVLLFIISAQPYAATFTFIFLAIKVLTLLKKP